MSRNIANIVRIYKNLIIKNLVIGVGRLVKQGGYPKVNDNLLRELRDQNASIEKLDVLDEFLGRLELEFGKPGDKKSIADKMTALKINNSFRSTGKLG